jgi:hypothetical protein
MPITINKVMKIITLRITSGAESVTRGRVTGGKWPVAGGQLPAMNAS